MTTAAQEDENLPRHAVHEIQQEHHSCQQSDETMADYLQINTVSMQKELEATVTPKTHCNCRREAEMHPYVIM